MSSNTYIHGPAKGYRHIHTVIFLHGRDSNAEEFSSEFFESEASASATTLQDRTVPALSPNVRWVFPQAPILHSKRFGMDMSQWFDMWSVENPEEQSDLQRDGLAQSIKMILEVIHAEEKILPRNHIFLGGISQGFATVLATIFSEGQGGFAGVIGLCSWMPFADKVEAEVAIYMREENGQLALFTKLQSLYGNGTKQASPAQIKTTPIFVAHATDDEVVPVENGIRMKHYLSLMGFNVEWKEYDSGGHWVNEPQGVNDIFRFFHRCLL